MRMQCCLRTDIVPRQVNPALLSPDENGGYTQGNRMAEYSSMSLAAQSYALVCAGLTRKQRAELAALSA